MLPATKPGRSPSSDGAPPTDEEAADPAQERHDNVQPGAVARHGAIQQRRSTNARQRSVAGAVSEMIEDRNGAQDESSMVGE